MTQIGASWIKLWPDFKKALIRSLGRERAAEALRHAADILLAEHEAARARGETKVVRLDDWRG